MSDWLIHKNILLVFFKKKTGKYIIHMYSNRKLKLTQLNFTERKELTDIEGRD